MIKIDNIIWKETFIEKIEGKHHLTMFEVEEILHGKKKVYRIEKGDVKGIHAKEVGADSVLIREIDFNYKLEKREYE